MMAKIISTRLARWLSGESTWANTHSVHGNPDARTPTILPAFLKKDRRQPESLEAGWPTNLAFAAVKQQ